MARLWDAIRESAARGGAAVAIPADSRRPPHDDPRSRSGTSTARSASDAPVRAIYPDGIHARDRRRACASTGFEVRTATLDEPEHGLTDAVLAETDVLTWWGHVAHDEVDGRGRRPGPGARPRRDGPDRPPLGPLLEDLPAADGHDLRPQVARGGRARAALGRRPGASDRRRARRVVRHRPTRRCTASISTSRRPTGSSSSAGSRAARCSAAAAATSAAGAASSTSGPGHETYPTYHEPHVRRVIANAARWAAGPAGAAPTFGNAQPLEPLPTEAPATPVRAGRAGARRATGP